MRSAACAALISFLAFGIGNAIGAEISGFTTGDPGLKSAGPLAFGPDGVLLIGDAKAAAVVAIVTGDTKGSAAKAEFDVPGIDKKIADALGATGQEITINDLAVNPQSGNVYLSISKRDGDKVTAAIVRVAAGGKVEPLAMDKAKYAKAVLADAPEDKISGEGRRRRNLREESITDIRFHDGAILVSGLSKSEAASTVRMLSYPPNDVDSGTSLEIFHGAHGRVEDYAAVRTFVPFVINGEPNLLAAYTCTPLVKFPVSSLVNNKKIRGTTVAELGNRNRPLDMLVYQKDGKEFLLLANSARGVMKISTDNIERSDGISERISGTAGQKYDTIEELAGVVQLDKLNDQAAVVVIENESGKHLKSIALP